MSLLVIGVVLLLAAYLLLWCLFVTAKRADEENERDVVRDVQRLHLEPGDMLILTVSHRMSAAQLAQVREQWKAAFRDHPAVVLGDEDMRLQVVSGLEAPE